MNQSLGAVQERITHLDQVMKVIQERLAECFDRLDVILTDQQHFTTDLIATVSAVSQDDPCRLAYLRRTTLIVKKAGRYYDAAIVRLQDQFLEMQTGAEALQKQPAALHTREVFTNHLQKINQQIDMIRLTLEEVESRIHASLASLVFAPNLQVTLEALGGMYGLETPIEG